MNKRQSQDDRFADDMSRRAELIDDLVNGMPGQPPPPENIPERSILEEVTRLCQEWAAADPSTEKGQQVFGTWAQIWAINGPGVFSINLNTGTVWWVRRNPPQKPVGKVAEMTGEQIVELLKER